jgi:hypothetical protein
VGKGIFIGLFILFMSNSQGDYELIHILIFIFIGFAFKTIFTKET